MEWEILMTSQVEAFLDDLYDNDRESHRLVNQAILVLECNGPAEGRPLVDVVTASRISNMKELRPPSTKRTEIRILFVFDPWLAERRNDMTEMRRWRDTDHLERAVQTAGGRDAFDAAIGRMLDETRGWRLADMRKRRGLTQEQVAERMKISASRVSQIESGDLSTQDVLTRYISALGGTLKLIADFGDEQLKVA